jgi:mannose/fructose/N-acetylgalactosamine-specific phosphotransferase system component IIC
MSRLFSLKTEDYVKGLVVGAGTAAVTAAFTKLNVWLAGGLQMAAGPELKMIGIAALSAFVAYVGKNFYTNSAGQFAKTEPPVQKPV